MASIKLDLWENPNFPPLDILESRTKTVLEAFNKCRKLDIKLQTHENDSRIKTFSYSFNSLTEKRAVESLRLSMFAEDVVIYMQLLSEENTSIGVILETLSSLLDASEERKKISSNLKDDYQEFLKKFNDEIVPRNFANLSSDSNSSELAIVRRNEEKIWILDTINVAVPILFCCGVFVFSRNLNLKHFLSKYSFLSILFLDRQNGINNIEKTKSDDSLNNDSARENEVSENDEESVEDIESINEHHPDVQNPFDGSSLLFERVGAERKQQHIFSANSLINWISKKVWKDEKLEDDINPNPENIDQNSFREEASNSTPSKALSTMVTKKDQSPSQGPLATSASIPPVSQTSDNLTSVMNLPSSDNRNVFILQYLVPGIFSVFLGYLMWRFLRKIKPNQYRWWKKFWNKGHKPNSRKILDEQQQIIEKESKILEIKEKLPVIIQNIEILDQFWENQIFNIKSHIETLKSVDENEKIKIPQKLATPIKEYWDKQVKESKANYIRTKELVTRNSLLTID